MKILFITNLYPTPNECARGVFIHNQAIALKKAGNDVAVLYMDFRSIRKKRVLYFSKLKFEGIPIYSMAIPLSPLRRIIEKTASYWAELAYKKIEKNFGRPDIIHGHFLDGTIGALRITKKYSIPLVMTEHGSGILSQNRNEHTEKLMNLIYPSCKEIAAVSQNLKRSICEVLPDKNVYVIPNILIGNFKYVQKSSCRKFTFLSVGNFVKSKRFDLTILAFINIHRFYPETYLKLVGDGIEMKKLKEMCREYGIEDCVEFTGSIPNRDLVYIYHQCSCFVLPSEFETFGVVYIEALASGLPVIGAKNGGAQEIINNNNGILVDVGSESQLEDAMKYMVENRGNYDSEKISKDCIDRYGTEKFINLIIDFYRDALTL